MKDKIIQVLEKYTYGSTTCFDSEFEAVANEIVKLMEEELKEAHEEGMRDGGYSN